MVQRIVVVVKNWNLFLTSIRRTEKGIHEVDVVVAIDKDGGEYGGREILVPSVVIRDVV